MNKKILSIIVILCTGITIFCMTQISKSIEEKRTNEIKQVFEVEKQKQDKIKQEKIKVEQEKQKAEKETNEKENKKNINKKNNIATSDKTERKKSNEKKDDDNENSELQNANDNIAKKESIKIEDNNTKSENITSEKSKTVFKVDKNTIIDKLSFSEKIKMMGIMKKLSVIDYGNIQKYLQGVDEYDSAKNICRILKSRLSAEDYKEVRDVLKPYIDIDSIEKEI